MVAFLFIGVYLMPIIAFFFIVLLLTAIHKIVKNRPYRKEMYWCGLFFAVLMWTLAMVTMMNGGL